MLMFFDKVKVDNKLDVDLRNQINIKFFWARAQKNT